MRLFDPRGRPIAATVPALDAIKLRNLVATRVAAYRSEPLGVPRRPSAGDLFFLARPFGRVDTVRTPMGSAQRAAFTDGELATIERLWREQRRRDGVGGAIGITTHDAEASRDPLQRLDTVMRRLVR